MRTVFGVISFLAVGAAATALIVLAPGKHDEQPNTITAVDDCGLALAESSFQSSPALEHCASDGHPDAMAWLGTMYWAAAIGVEQDLTLPDGPRTKAQFEARGLDLIQSASLSGQVIAANELGVAYMFGRYGLDQDYPKAMELFQVAHDGGDALATQNMAAMYANGWGTPKSKYRAIKYLEQSAERGSVVALWTLGSFHLAKDTPEDKEIADAYFKRADQLGGECARPSEICDDFKVLFEKNELIAANEYIVTVPLTYC